MCARRDSNLRGTGKNLAPEDRRAPSRVTKLFDLLCAGALFLLAIAASMLIPKTYTGRIWVYGTNLALLFAAMLNLLRIQNGLAMRGVRMFSITANVAMLALFIALMVSIGASRTLSNAQIPAIAGLLIVETGFSLRRNE